jgi:transcriptional regulator with XRE-family HTH domain
MATIHPVVLRFARRLREARQHAGITQAALATRAKLARPYVTQLEAGVREPSVVTVMTLAKALRVSVAVLLE